MPSPPTAISTERLAEGRAVVGERLLAERTGAGTWEGELSRSALATATSITAIELYCRSAPSAGSVESPGRLAGRVRRGIDWLAGQQNADGGWGDTTRSHSNISTTMLAHAALVLTGHADSRARLVNGARTYIESAGGVAAVLVRYGRDRTFSVPILTQCALAGTVDWADVIALPFELGCLPHRFYSIVGLPVVSYALPALIAIGQVRYQASPPANPLLRLVRRLAIPRSRAVLDRIQPSNGGFLEAAPLTSFVAMSLVACGRAADPVTRRAIDFLCHSQRPDGSWPIDTNLATWVTTLSVNALGDRLPVEARPPILRWLLDQQVRQRHPYTNAAPGGWAWTDLPGGVPDADDTAGALLAVMRLDPGDHADDPIAGSLEAGVGWLLSLQNRDGGWPTFCRGWGKLPFDRSSADITAHVLRALLAWSRHRSGPAAGSRAARRTRRAVARGFAFLAVAQREDGTWIPLWFGNQNVANDENPTYGTARVLAAYRAAGTTDQAIARRGRQWIATAQNADGGWGGDRGVPSSVEETALAVDAIVGYLDTAGNEAAGLEWLLRRIEERTLGECSPIGFYFARLWYFEKLYPLIFTAAALDRVAAELGIDGVDRSE